MLWDGILGVLVDGVLSTLVDGVACLPGALVYGVAGFCGDWRYRYDERKREEVMRNLYGVLGERLSCRERARVTRDVFRLHYCNMVDMMRLAGKERALASLVEIRGREYLESALAEGQGAIVCGAHFGSFLVIPALLLASGFPVTTVGRLFSSPERLFPLTARALWQKMLERCLVKHSYRPIIQPEPKQRHGAVQMMRVLRNNEVIAMAIDPPPLPDDDQRAVTLEFLGQQARFLTGSTAIAQITHAPLLVVFLHRSADWRHQVLEILPPVAVDAVDGGVEMMFGRCMAMIEAAILREPAHWVYWLRADELARLGLLCSMGER
jgi:KDO2-lipid IV(A) lauroyltransferase